MIDEKVLIEHIKHHKETVYPSHAMAAAIYELAHDHFIDMVNIQPKVGGWIPCSERMPGKPEENPVFENKPLELYLVTVNNTKYPFRAFWNGKFFTDGWNKVDAIAWMPLPEPYDANTEAEKPQWQQQMMNRFLKGE